jgi:glycosyltransferase involved in cell wall biosynthesis
MQPPLVSIIVPAFNSEKYISEAIRSALAQSWEQKEVIIVDDGSSDRTFEIAKSFEREGQVKVFKQKNSGSCAARNLGFRESKGDFIQYLDADDLLSPEKLTSQLSILKALPEGYVSSCGWARFSHSISEAIFTEQPVWKDMSPVEWLVTAWQGGGMMQTACWLTPRAVIEKAGPWNEALKKNPNDDGEFFCRVLLNSKGIKFDSHSKVYYRSHEGPRVSKGSNRVSVHSLLQTCISYEENIFRVEKSERTINALAVCYASFIYQFIDEFPDLAKVAEQRIRQLGIKKIPPQGGKYFLLLAKAMGFLNALHLRSVLRKLKRNQLHSAS